MEQSLLDYHMQTTFFERLVTVSIIQKSGLRKKVKLALVFKQKNRKIAKKVPKKGTLIGERLLSEK